MSENYEAPQITLVGSVEALTAHTSSGHKTDQNFGTGTDIGDIIDHGVS